MLLDGKSEVKLFGEMIQVEANIERLAGVSGHADKNGLVQWLQSIKKKPDRVFVVHGDDIVCEEFTEYIRKQLGYNAVAPYSGTIYDLKNNKCLVEGERIPVKRRGINRK